MENEPMANQQKALHIKYYELGCFCGIQMNTNSKQSTLNDIFLSPSSGWSAREGRWCATEQNTCVKWLFCNLL